LNAYSDTLLSRSVVGKLFQNARPFDVKLRTCTGYLYQLGSVEVTL